MSGIVPLKSQLAVLFSGGLDSSILLAHLLSQGRRVWPLYVSSNLHWQAEELRSARRFLAAVSAPGLEELTVLELPLADLYEDHWSITGQGVPQAEDPDEKVYLPGRNPLLIIKAHVWCRLHGVPQLALGSLKSNPFTDATDAFFSQFESALDRAVAGHVELLRPFATYEKRRVMRLSDAAPLEWTFSCLAPTGHLHCGACNKCAERRQAFSDAGLVDPTRYASSRPVTIASKG